MQRLCLTSMEMELPKHQLCFTGSAGCRLQGLGLAGAPGKAVTSCLRRKSGQYLQRVARRAFSVDPRIEPPFLTTHPSCFPKKIAPKVAPVDVPLHRSRRFNMHGKTVSRKASKRCKLYVPDHNCRYLSLIFARPL